MSHENGKYYKAADKVQLIAKLLDETLSTADRVELQERSPHSQGCLIAPSGDMSKGSERTNCRDWWLLREKGMT